MADHDSSFVLIAENANKPPCKGSKRKSLQLFRHGPKPAVRANCRHPQKTQFKCAEVSTRDVEAFNTVFYRHTSKVDQDNMVAKFLKVSSKATTRKRNAATQRTRNSCETTFFVKKQSKEVVRICKDFFLKMLGIGRTRVENIAKHSQQDSGLRTEKRGGDRKTVQYGDKRLAVRTFIKQLRGRESHYDRTKTKKLYLPSTVTSIKCLWKMYTAVNVNQPVRYEFFRRIFTREFRIGFGSPKTDACSMCERLKNQIKMEADPVKKQTLLITQLRIHKLRANAFYLLLNERREGLKTFCFDHQQNQVLPKVPDQIAYYSRQLYMYNFSVVETREDGTLTPENVYIYTWKENDFPKNSSSCASAVFHVLNNSSLENVDTVRLVSDACGGQNKNSAFIYMACHWLTKQAPPHVKRVEFVFPVRGHSFLPCDRVFGVMELALRKKERIYTPEEYLDVFREQGTVRVAGDDWHVLNFKECSDKALKKPLPIKIQENKRFILTKGKTVTVRAEPNYRNDLNTSQAIIKKGHSFSQNPGYVVQGIDISDMKKADIRKLILEHVGEGWEADPRFSFLKSILSGTDHIQTGTCSVEDEELCNCLGEDAPTDKI